MLFKQSDTPNFNCTKCGIGLGVNKSVEMFESSMFESSYYVRCPECDHEFKVHIAEALVWTTEEVVKPLLKCSHCGELTEKQYRGGNWYCGDCFISLAVENTPETRRYND